ncbi:hypothetical protein Sgly_1605 [Syntrophobotulus glycolicus DSM 8271]|uniref:EpsG family protein n=1 Tax=Syntrophobotulus glycolicus (strain DSM 8271 / FlGlyR) TaxID=645991 RepID=F0SY68_SYNGF|nr:EpsG family protein [Syntrophobotulus glycolicus]ADY55903.1 hypothetical protein Sgly_1605 [Syntrophobotulus glycolicus DSM 8271]
MELSLFSSVFLYVSIVILSSLLIRLAEKEGIFQKLFVFLAFLVVALPSAFRYEVGLDYTTYTTIYDIIVGAGSITDSVRFFNIEYSFRVLSFISHDLLDSPQMIFSFYAVFTNLFMVLGIYFYRKQTRMSTMMFMYTTLYYLLSMNIARQMLAVSIIFFASKYILKKSFIKYLIFVLLAACFHKSSIVAIVLYFISIKTGISNKVVTVFKYVFPIIIIFFMHQFLNLFASVSFFQKYLINYHVTSQLTIGLGIVLQLGLCLIFYIVYKKNLLGSSKATQYFIVQTMIFGTILFLLQYRIDNFGGRMGLYFNIFSIVALSLLANSADRKKTGLKYDFQLIPYMYALLLFIMDLINDSQGCLPYTFWTGFN